MDKKIVSIVNDLFAPLGMTVRRTKEAIRENRHALALTKIILSRIEPMSPEKSGLPAEGIIFSKNRALQLDALLASYAENVHNRVPLHLLYRATTTRHARAYEQVIDRHRAELGTIEAQHDFRGQTVSMMESIMAPRIFFLVDDILIIRPIDFSAVGTLSSQTFVISLRMAPHLTYCYTLKKEQPVPPLIRHSSGLLTWRWSEGQCDWAYPLSLDGHLFGADELRCMVESIDFSAPNSLEKALQEFNDIFLPRSGACFDGACVVNLPINKVQTEIDNQCGTLHEDDLLALWERGMRMDYAALYGASTRSAHEELAINFVKR